MMSQDLFSGSRHPMDYSFKCSVPSRVWSQAPLTFASLWGGRGAGGLLSLEFRGHIPIKSPECSPQVSSTWSSEVHVAPHSEQGDVSAGKFTFSLLLYSMWGLDSSFGFSHSTPHPFNRWGIWGHGEFIDLSRVTQQVRGYISPESTSPTAS